MVLPLRGRVERTNRFSNVLSRLRYNQEIVTGKDNPSKRTCCPRLHRSHTAATIGQFTVVTHPNNRGIPALSHLLEEVHTAERGIGKDDDPECLGQLFGQSVNQTQCKLGWTWGIFTAPNSKPLEHAKVTYHQVEHHQMQSPLTIKYMNQVLELFELAAFLQGSELYDQL